MIEDTRKTVTVVIPTLNEERAIAACLESVDDERAEIVISDGGSFDSTIDIATGVTGVRVVVGAPGRGPQLNRGAAGAVTPILLFLHADCRLPGGWLNTVADTLADSRNSLACFRLRTHSTGRGGRGGRLQAAWTRLLDVRSLTPLLPYGDQGFALRRTDFEAIGGFPDIPLMEDTAMAKACRQRGLVVRMPMEIRTTDRRFQRHPIRARIMTTIFPMLFRIGVSPRRLAAWYQHVR